MCNQQAQVCPVCKGKGTVPYSFYQPYQYGYTTINYSYEVPCRSCKGQGIVFPPCNCQTQPQVVVNGKITINGESVNYEVKPFVVTDEDNTKSER